MEVRKEHAVDCGERDAVGFYDYYYAYWLFWFRDGIRFEINPGEPADIEMPEEELTAGAAEGSD